MEFSLRNVVRGIAVTGFLAAAPFSLSSKGVSTNTACAGIVGDGDGGDGGATCCAQDIATCIVETCSGWGPWEKCTPTTVQKSYYNNKEGACDTTVKK